MSIENKIATKAQTLVSMEQEPGSEHPNETKYRALCESFPIMLRTFGLAQTLAYLRPNDAKPGKRLEHARLYGAMSAHFVDLGLLQEGRNLSDFIASLENLQKYRLYSQIALRIALWHKRLAQALLRTKSN